LSIDETALQVKMAVSCRRAEVGLKNTRLIGEVPEFDNVPVIVWFAPSATDKIPVVAFVPTKDRSWNVFAPLIVKLVELVEA
jgi:hypothetical protein